MKKMTKSTKILVIVLAVTVAVCAVIIAVSIGVNRKNTKTPSSLPEESHLSDGVTSSFFDLDDETAWTPTTTQAPALATAILGAWKDSAGMSGYEFFEDGKVTVTYFDLTIPVINLPLSGTADGTYTLNDDLLTVNFSIYTKTITRRYTAAVDANQLRLKEDGSGEVSTYMRAASSDLTEPTQRAGVDDELTGTWVSADAAMRYIFSGDGLVTMTFAGVKLPDYSRKKLSGSYTGVYMNDGDTLTIQFMLDGDRVTQTYTYSVTTKALSLKSRSGDTLIFLRDGIGALPEDTGSAEDLIGKWRDGTGAGGYTFKDGGIVEITYVDITVPVVNIPINGSFRGTYEVNGNALTLRYSIYGKAITENYTFVISGNTLTLTNTANGDVSVYMK